MNGRAVVGLMMAAALPPAVGSAAGGESAAPRYLLTVLNLNYFSAPSDQILAVEALRNFLALARERGVEPELYFTGLSFDMHCERAAEIMQELRQSGRDWHHHGANRDPRPQPIERVRGLPWDKAVEAILDYEQRAIDPETGQLDSSRPGGLKKMIDYFGRPPLSTGRFVKAPILEACKRFGAKMGVGTQDWFKLDSAWFWHMGTLNRPDDTFVHPTWDFNEWVRYSWIQSQGAQASRPALVQSRPDEPINIHERIEARLAQLDPDLPAFVTFTFHNNDFFGFNQQSARRHPPEMRRFYMEQCAKFLDWMLKEKGFKPVSLRQAYEMAAARNLKPAAEEAESLARQIVESIEAGQGLPEQTATARSAYSLTEAWQLFAARLAGRPPQFPDLIGPTQMRPPTDRIGDFAANDVRKAAGSMAVEGAVDSEVALGGARINAAEFLHLMAQAVLGRDPVRGAPLEMIQPFVRGGQMNDDVDKLQFWTHKAAYYADTGGRVQKATSTEVNTRGRTMRRSGQEQRLPPEERPPF